MGGDNMFYEEPELSLVIVDRTDTIITSGEPTTDTGGDK